MKQEETYEEMMWNQAAKEREEARDQATDYKARNAALMKEKVELEKDRDELVEQLKSYKLEISKQKRQMEQDSRKSKSQEREYITLKQEKSELERDKAELADELNACRFETAKQEVSRRNTATQTQSEAETNFMTTQEIRVSLMEWASESAGNVVSHYNAEVSTKLQTYEEGEHQDYQPEDPREGPQHDQQESEEGILQ
jgi:chromosome segregation ATPase